MRKHILTLLAGVALVAGPAAAMQERSRTSPAVNALGEPGSQDFEPTPDPIEVVQPFRVTGAERLAWDQPAASYDELRNLGFLAQIEGAESVSLLNVECRSTPGPNGFACTSRLPSLPDGAHVLRVSAYSNRNRSEPGPPSEPLLLEFGRSSDAALVASGLRRFVTADGVELIITTVVSGLETPTALAALPDGRLIVAEARGTVRVIREGTLVPDPALTLTGIATGDGRGLLAMTADRDFESTALIYTLHTTEDGLRLSRHTLHEDHFVDTVTLVDGLPVSEAWPSVALGMGPDRHLFVGLDDAGDPDRSEDLGSYSGKVLRFSADGTTPDDQAAASPVYLAGVHRPTAVTWDGDAPDVWITEAGVNGAARLTRSERHDTDPATAVGRFLLPTGTSPLDAVFYSFEAIPAFTGNLFIVSGDAHAILRVRFDEDRGVADSEWLLRGQVGPIRTVAVDTGGAIYVATDHAVMRITQAQ